LESYPLSSSEEEGQSNPREASHYPRGKWAKGRKVQEDSRGQTGGGNRDVDRSVRLSQIYIARSMGASKTESSSVKREPCLISCEKCARRTLREPNLHEKGKNQGVTARFQDGKNSERGRRSLGKQTG